MLDNARTAVETLEEGHAIQLAWRQVESSELAAILRRMPQKLRNRMLSTNRVPSSKISATTARLLIASIGRRGGNERYHAARVITQPIAHTVEHVVNDAVGAGDDVVEELTAFVKDRTEDDGATILVLAAVSHAFLEPDLYLGFFVACRQAGILTEELAVLAESLAPLAEGLIDVLESQAEDLGVDEAERRLEPTPELGNLEVLWETARGAARRVYAAVRDGRVPDDDDITCVESYATALASAAQAAAVVPTMDALAAATQARETLAGLEGLEGPESLTDSIEMVRALVASGVQGDEATRLEVFARLVAEPDPMARMALVAQLRGTSPPPAPELVDASLAGLLTINPAKLPAAVMPAGPVAQQSESGPPAVAMESRPSRDQTPLDSEDEEAPKQLAPVAQLEPVRVETVRPTRDAPDTSSALSPRSTSTVPVLTALVAAEEAIETPSLSDENVAATFARVVAEGRFDLGHHMAKASGQTYRAAILREAALADSVRTASSASAAEMVADVGEVPLNAADIGGVILRCAAELRVALLDPGSGAPALLRAIVPALDARPALRELVGDIAAATEQMVAVSANGVALDVAEAFEEAEAIASWAQDTLDRPPRHTRLYRGLEIWKTWSAPRGPLGIILNIVAANDSAHVGEVRAACEPFGRRVQIERAVDSADRDLRTGRAGRTQRIIGPAKQQLIRNAEEIVAQGLAWCNANARITGHQWSAGVYDDLAAAVGRLRPRVMEEMDALFGDAWLEATARAARRSISATLGLLSNEGLEGSELDPSTAVNRCLALVVDLPLDVDLSPKSEPTLAQLVAAAGWSRLEAFGRRLEAGDFVAAEALLDLTTGAAADFDSDQARAHLASREREERTKMSRRWDELDRTFAAARARGRIREDDAARIYGELLQARPVIEENDVRRDLGAVASELDRIHSGLLLAIKERREQVAIDVATAIEERQVSERWGSRLRTLLERDEIGAAEEYLYRAQAGEEPPEANETEVDRDVDVATVVEAWPTGIDPAVVAAAEAGAVLGPLDFSTLSELDRPAIAAGLAAWIALSRGERPEDLAGTLNPVLRLLGLIPQKIERPARLRAAGSASRWFVEVHGDQSGYAFVPDFGSRSQGRRRFMLCWDDLPASQLWDASLTDALADQPVYVLQMGMLSAEARRALAREARKRASGRVVVIDDAVVASCAQAGRQAWDVTMRAVLPYAAANPYDPDLLVNTPEEMFYGRRAERDKVAAPAGTSFISGGRRFGKSALLRAAQQTLSGTDVVVLLVVIQNVAAIPPNDPAELWPVLAARLIEAGVLKAGCEGTADAVASGIRHWLEINPERRLLLLLDECDFFLKADAGSSFHNVVILRDLMSYDPAGDGGGRFKVVFSGLQHVTRYRKLPNQPLSHLPQPLVIGPLDPSSASRLVSRPMRALGWQISDAQVARIVTYCACNPSVIQLACMQLVDRLRRTPISDLAPWAVPDEILNELLHSPELARGVRDRLFYTLELDHRYKLLAYLVAWRALTEGAGEAASASELRATALEYWPEGFAGQDADDVRALCDELVGLGVFAGDAESGYRMLSPATIRLFGSVDDMASELMTASETYVPDIAAGAAGSRIALGEDRFSPLTAGQLADVVGVGNTQLRVIVGSRALRMESVPAAIAKAIPSPWAEMIETSSLRQWRDAMPLPREGHRVVVADMTGRSRESWEQSIEAARRRGGARTARGTRAAVLVAGPNDRWLLSRLVTTNADAGDLADLVVGLRRIDIASLRAWDRIEELDLAHPLRQARLLEVTGGWPMLVERVLAEMHHHPFEVAIEALAARLAGADGARGLVAAVGLDPEDPDQPTNPGVAEVFRRLADTGWHDDIETLVELLELDEAITEDRPAEVLAILRVLGALHVDEEGIAGIEPVLAACEKQVEIVSSQ
jgi:hypothetical protein